MVFTMLFQLEPQDVLESSENTIRLTLFELFPLKLFQINKEALDEMLIVINNYT